MAEGQLLVECDRKDDNIGKKRQRNSQSHFVSTFLLNIELCTKSKLYRFKLARVLYVTTQH